MRVQGSCRSRIASARSISCCPPHNVDPDAVRPERDVPGVPRGSGSRPHPAALRAVHTPDAHATHVSKMQTRSIQLPEQRSHWPRGRSSRVRLPIPTNPAAVAIASLCVTLETVAAFMSACRAGP